MSFTLKLQVFMKKKGKKKYFPAHELFLEFTNKNDSVPKSNKFGFKNSFKIYFLYDSCLNFRDANFYGLPIVTMENWKNFQFSTVYGKLKFLYGNFFFNK